MLGDLNKDKVTLVEPFRRGLSCHRVKVRFENSAYGLQRIASACLAGMNAELWCRGMVFTHEASQVRFIRDNCDQNYSDAITER